MKTCSVCGKIYKDEHLNFCLEDGGVLIEDKDDAPPTILLNQTRTTNPNYSDYEPSSPWGTQPIQTYQQSQPVYQNYQSPGMPTGSNQVLPIISLVLGIVGVFCCWGGIAFGIGAAITGYIGYQNAERDPMNYGGRGMAIAGLVLGIVALVFSALFIIFSIIGSF